MPGCRVSERQKEMNREVMRHEVAERVMEVGGVTRRKVSGESEEQVETEGAG